MDSNDITRDITQIKSGDRISVEWLNSVASAINKRRGGVNPPSQVFPQSGGGFKTFFADAATTSTSTSHSGLAAIDGYTPIDGDNILDWNNATALLKGLWIAHSGAWTQIAVPQGQLIPVINGSTYLQSIWVANTPTSFSQYQIVSSILTANLCTLVGVTASGSQTVDTIATGTNIVFDANASKLYRANTSGAWTVLATNPAGVLVSDGSANGPVAYVRNIAGTYAAIAGLYS